MITLGIDPSLTATGVVKIVNGKIKVSELIKSSPCGKKPIDELNRLTSIRNAVLDLASDADLVAIEGLAFSPIRTTALTQLSGLNYLIRAGLNQKFIVVAPTMLKKYATGKGNISKDLIMLETYKQFKQSFDNNNLCDAFILAKIAESLMDKKVKLISFRQEIINKLKEQIWEK
jgi:crossover junction endodeoxyribonuclease RuvC